MDKKYLILNAAGQLRGMDREGIDPNSPEYILPKEYIDKIISEHSQKWIAAVEGLPVKGVPCLFCDASFHGNSYVSKGTVRDRSKGGMWQYFDDTDKALRFFTHWQPLPKHINHKG